MLSRKHFHMQTFAAALEIVYPRDSSNKMMTQKMVNCFGATSDVTYTIYKLLYKLGELNDNFLVEHLLWVLYLVKKYPREKEFEERLNKTDKTIQKYVKPLHHSFLKVLPLVVSIVFCFCFFMILLS